MTAARNSSSLLSELSASVEALTQGNEVPLAAGDVIHAVINTMVTSVPGLRALVDEVKGTRDLVLRIERNGQLLFVTCHIED